MTDPSLSPLGYLTDSESRFLRIVTSRCLCTQNQRVPILPYVKLYLYWQKSNYSILSILFFLNLSGCHLSGVNEGLTDTYDCQVYTDPTTGHGFAVYALSDMLDKVYIKRLQDDGSDEDALNNYLTNPCILNAVALEGGNTSITSLNAASTVTLEEDSSSINKILDKVTEWNTTAQANNLTEITKSSSDPAFTFQIDSKDQHSFRMDKYGSAYLVEDIPAFRKCLEIAKTVRTEFNEAKVKQLSDQEKSKEENGKAADNLLK